MSDELDDAERKARRLLWWATVLAFVAITVCALDVMIKNQILDQAKRSQGWLDESARGLDRLRRDLAGFTGDDGGQGETGGPVRDPGDSGVAGVDSLRARAQSDAGQDADL
jgi:hypothetical protein